MQRRRRYVIGLSHLSVHPFVGPFIQSDIVATISRERLEQFFFGKTDGECSLAPTGGVIRLWRSKVKVATDRQGQVL